MWKFLIFFNVKLLDSEKILHYNNIYEALILKKLNEKFGFIEKILIL
jgi:hypothetical protein